VWDALAGQTRQRGFSCFLIVMAPCASRQLMAITILLNKETVHEMEKSSCGIELG
jgi:hypothetical protein